MVKQLALAALGRDGLEVFYLKQYNTMIYKKILIAVDGKEPPYFSDLNLDQIVNTMVKNKDRYDLQPLFRKLYRIAV